MAMETRSRWRSFSDLPRAFGEPLAHGRLRVSPEDFRVDEIPAFEPDGEGEHVLLHVRKTGANTEWVARRLASHAKLPVSAVGFAGLKDRHAVTTQWFSLHLGPHQEPDWRTFAAEGVEILEMHRHRRKIRRGALRGNRFLIRLRDWQASSDELGERVARIRQRGLPNYFGQQRFGNGDGNLHAADALFAGRQGRVKRHLRGLWISAARSQLFNEVLAKRVERGDWDRALRGDRLQLAGSHSHFSVETVDDRIRQRVSAFDVHPTGPLWGAGDLLCLGEPAKLDRAVAERFPEWVDGLQSERLRQERRSLRLPVPDLVVREGSDHLELGFDLPAGAYATAVLREIADWSEYSSNAHTTDYRPAVADLSR